MNIIVYLLLNILYHLFHCYICIYSYVIYTMIPKAVGCSTISILWQEAEFVKAVLVPYEYLHVEGSLLLKYLDCTAYNGL